jgi:hypothetical protein
MVVESDEFEATSIREQNWFAPYEWNRMDDPTFFPFFVSDQLEQQDRFVTRGTFERG